MLYKFKLGYNTLETTKNIFCAKGEGTNDHTVSRWFKKFCSDCKNHNKQPSSGRNKTVDFKIGLKGIEANPASSTQRVLSEFGISQSSVAHHLLNPSESFQSCWIVPNIAKILQNF